ncbi:MAG: FecR domain-containing protein [Leptospiraceae bacterium]|nr:FecR domain-containing protein [Leptospiraceae bacterium]
MKFWNNNWNIPAFLIFNAVLFSFLFYYDLHKNINVGSLETIGSVSFKLNSIQRKMESGVVWQSISANTFLHNRDTVRTLPESDMIINLNNGTEIQLEENSMVYLDMKDNVPNINFDSGSIQINNSKSANPNQQVVINSNNQTLKISGGDAKIDTSGKEINISMESGSAIIESNGKTQKLNSNEMATIGESGITTRISPYTLYEPINQKKFISMSFPYTINFSWKATGANTNTSFELSKVKDFKKVDLRLQDVSSANLKLTPGTYYWRVSGKNSAGVVEYSENRKFILIQESGLQLFSPIPGSVNEYKSGTTDISFSWTPSETINEYYVEIATNSSFTSNFKIIPVKTNSITLNNLGEGTYFWRVITKPSTDGIPAMRSNVSSFIISSNLESKSFELLAPADNSNLPMNVNPAKNLVTFRWKSTSATKKYRIQISRSSSFQDLLINEITTNSVYSAVINKEGTYFWKVAQFFGDTQSPFSTPKSFTIGTLPQEEKTTDLATTDESKNVDNSDSKKIDQPKEVPKTPDPKGIGNLPPRNLSPLSGKIDISKQKLIRFQWGKVENASYYILKIMDSGNKAKTLVTEKTSANSFVLKNFSKLSEGAFLWEVTPFDKKNKPGKAGKGKFSIVLDNDGLKKLKPEEIKILSPDTIYRDK